MTLKISTRVLPGNRVEVTAPGLKEGEEVEVILIVPRDAKRRPSMSALLAQLPPGPRLFQSPEEADEYLRRERESWDR